MDNTTDRLVEIIAAQADFGWTGLAHGVLNRLKEHPGLLVEWLCDHDYLERRHDLEEHYWIHGPVYVLVED